MSQARGENRSIFTGTGRELFFDLFFDMMGLYFRKKLRIHRSENRDRHLTLLRLEAPLKPVSVPSLDPLDSHALRCALAHEKLLRKQEGEPTLQNVLSPRTAGLRCLIVPFPTRAPRRTRGFRWGYNLWALWACVLADPDIFTSLGAATGGA